MPVRKKTSTTRLPQSLLQELDGSSSTHTHSNLHSKSRTSRKDIRKQARIERKQKKATHFSHEAVRHGKRPADSEHVDSPKRKRPRPGDIQVEPAKALSDGVRKVEASVEHKQAAVSEKKSENRSKNVTNVQMHPKLPKSRREEQDEAYITYLESKLGYSRGKKKKKAIEDDGLDDLLDWADSLVSSTKQNDSDMDDVLQSPSTTGSEMSEDEESDESEEWGGIDNDNDSASENKAQLPAKTLSSPGRVYVPPHLRGTHDQGDKNSEEIQKLTRQLKGLLNRMSEQNISSILDSIEEVYRNHRRNDITTTLSTLIIDGISAQASLLDSYVVLYAAFVSSMHKIVGIEFAAHFVQNAIAAFEHHFSTMEVSGVSSTDNNPSVEGKECSNLIVLLSELYNFQVISSILVFDLIRELLQNRLNEFTIELLLKIARNSGQQLRQDDPAALKDIIQIVQNKVSGDEGELSSRTRFMIETLVNLKNNKLKRNTTQNQGGEAVERMKKFLAGLSKKKHVLAHEPLRVSLDDLHSAQSKGKWWLVGAAWGGDPLVDRQRNTSPTFHDVNGVQDDTSDALVKLAKKQGMNTDIRRSIFIVLMSSEDYVDACERLSQLNLTEVQQRDIIRVLLHCCGNEQTYNPYYTLVCQQLCRVSRSYQITLQFCLWDFLRDLGESKVGGEEVIKNIKDDEDFGSKDVSKIRLTNVAKAYGWWIAKDCITLAVLKPIDFTLLKPQSKEFLKTMFINVFINSQIATPLVNPKGVTRNKKAVEEIFIKASKIPALAMGLVYYISQNFGPAAADGNIHRQLVQWAAGVAKDTLNAGLEFVPTL